MTCACDDMLVLVQAELCRRDGELRDIAEAADMHYDTVRRIRSGKNDPGYSKVKRLALHLGLAAPCAVRVCPSCVSDRPATVGASGACDITATVDAALPAVPSLVYGRHVA